MNKCNGNTTDTHVTKHDGYFANYQFKIFFYNRKKVIGIRQNYSFISCITLTQVG